MPAIWAAQHRGHAESSDTWVRCQFRVPFSSFHRNGQSPIAEGVDNLLLSTSTVVTKRDFMHLPYSRPTSFITFRDNFYYPAQITKKHDSQISSHYTAYEGNNVVRGKLVYC